jgi:hypothetical protein
VEPNSGEELAWGIREVATRLGDFDREKQHQYVVENFSQTVVVRKITEHYYLALERHGEAGNSMLKNLAI